MSVRILCDVCGQDIKEGELSMTISHLEKPFFANQQGQIMQLKKDVCEACKKKILSKIGEIK